MLFHAQREKEDGRWDTRDGRWKMGYERWKMEDGSLVEASIN
jgi:hypothetical protein